MAYREQININFIQARQNLIMLALIGSRQRISTFDKSPSLSIDDKSR